MLTLLTTGCSVKQIQLSCAQRDWYEIGRSDGAQGLPAVKLDGYRRECRGDLQGNNEMIYLNGRNAGLVEYCQPESGFQLGRAGQTYDRVCVATVEPPFLAAYARGLRARAIEQRGKDLDAEIETLSNQLLRTEGASAQRQLSVQLKLLRQARSRADHELGQVYR